MITQQFLDKRLYLVDAQSPEEFDELTVQIARGLTAGIAQPVNDCRVLIEPPMPLRTIVAAASIEHALRLAASLPDFAVATSGSRIGPQTIVALDVLKQANWIDADAIAWAAGGTHVPLLPGFPGRPHPTGVFHLVDINQAYDERLASEGDTRRFRSHTCDGWDTHPEDDYSQFEPPIAISSDCPCGLAWIDEELRSQEDTTVIFAAHHVGDDYCTITGVAPNPWAATAMLQSIVAGSARVISDQAPEDLPSEIQSVLNRLQARKDISFALCCQIDREAVYVQFSADAFCASVVEEFAEIVRSEMLDEVRGAMAT